jgi:hypothetical protein
MAGKETKPPRGLMIMPDYASSGIWAFGAVGAHFHGMIEPETLGVSPALAQRFRNWIEMYESEDCDAVEFDSQGRELARELKLHVGDQIRVLYAPDGPWRTEEIYDDAI